MRTRSGFCYTNPEKRSKENCAAGERRKRSKLNNVGKSDLFDSLPDDIVLSILSKLSSGAECPADFISVLLTCKRLNGLGVHSMVLSKASKKMVAVKAQSWSHSAHRFLMLCADAGNVEACYILGMIRFYCMENRGSGASLMAKAAIGSHAPALYSLAVIQFNGSGGSKNDKDLRAGVALCARAAFLGHVDALRELGHCLQDGYGVKRNRSAGCPLLSDFGCNIPAPDPHPANNFLTDWFAAKDDGAPGSGLRLCSHPGCGRPETRVHEFRRCSVCGAVNYCSRACQAMDWRSRHKSECAPAERWPGENAPAPAPANVVHGEAVVVVDNHQTAVS
nr:F-box protein At1g67340 [Ipomoea batatas]